MRVLYVVSTLRHSGPVVMLRGLVEHLDRDEVDPVVLTLSPEPTNSDAARFRDLDVPVRSLDLSRLRGFVEGPRRLRSAVSEASPDVVHSHGFRPDLLAAAALDGVPRVSTVHNYPYYDYPEKFGRAPGTAVAFGHLRSLKALDHPVACSYATAQTVRRRRLDPHVIQNGVDDARYRPATADERRHARADLDLPADADVYVYVGSMIDLKNPKKLVSGFLAGPARRGARLLMVGDGPVREELAARVSGTAAVRFTGFVDDVGACLDAADYFVSASRYEGLPMAALEALAAGLPVGLSDIPPHRELLRVDADAGATFPLGEADSVGEALTALSARDYDAASAAARRVVTERLNAERMACKYRNLYEYAADA